MISLSNLFLEIINVPCEHPSGITVPFGVIDPSKRNKKILASAQDLSGKDLEQQVRWMKKNLK